MLGWLDGADGRQRGLRYADSDGVLHRTYRPTPDFQGCGHADPDHSYEGGRIEYNGSVCDGWLRAGNNDEFAIGFYTKQDLPFTGDAATRWTVCDLKMIEWRWGLDALTVRDDTATNLAEVLDFAAASRQVQ